jgi:hypothetical protein
MYNTLHVKPQYIVPGGQHLDNFISKYVDSHARMATSRGKFQEATLIIKKLHSRVFLPQKHLASLVLYIYIYNLLFMISAQELKLKVAGIAWIFT